MNRKDLNNILKSCGNFKLKFGRKEIFSHTSILEIFFPDYFDRVFASQMREVRQGKIDLPDNEFDCFQTALNMLIFDKMVSVNEDNLVKYLEFSDKYQFLPFTAQCEKFILGHFEEIDVKDIVKLADLYHLEAVKPILIQKIMQKELLGHVMKHSLFVSSFMNKNVATWPDANEMSPQAETFIRNAKQQEKFKGATD
ncbi:hypothetical protein PHSC3_000820 [Chlamydiales bacterium STE3]|nr:hypothetical protein PHSC3_000820 [Chlamydiales bacterium STE3]